MPSFFASYSGESHAATVVTDIHGTMVGIQVSSMLYSRSTTDIDPIASPHYLLHKHHLLAMYYRESGIYLVM
jgi:hypothetical protein